jgi:hypothetical protein
MAAMFNRRFASRQVRAGLAFEKAAPYD